MEGNGIEGGDTTSMHSVIKYYTALNLTVINIIILVDSHCTAFGIR